MSRIHIGTAVGLARKLQDTPEAERAALVAEIRRQYLARYLASDDPFARKCRDIADDVDLFGLALETGRSRAR